jgi:P-type Ca2+ transporter type 2C
MLTIVPPAISLGLEPAEADIMDRKPRNPKEGVLTKINCGMIVMQSLLMTFVTFTVYFYAVNYNFLGVDNVVKRQSLAFTLLTTMQLVQSFLSRSITNSIFTTGIIENRILVFSFFLAFGLMLVGLAAEPFSSILGLANPNAEAWGVIWIAVAAQVVYIEFLKLIARRYILNEKPIENRASPVIEDKKPVIVEA